jgi:hypothetical protein
MALLIKFYPIESNFRVARMLGRSQKNIAAKAIRLGLRKSPYARIHPGASKYRNVLPRRVRRG